MGLVTLPYCTFKLSAQAHLLPPSAIKLRLEHLHLVREGHADTGKRIDTARQLRNLGLRLA
ncbi:hypothetical protein SNARM312S_00665 [Streptomyces narbonensis]